MSLQLPQRSQWRTLIGILSLGGMMLLAELMCPHDARQVVAQAVVLGLGGLGGALAAKTGWQAHSEAKAAATVATANCATPAPPAGG